MAQVLDIAPLRSLVAVADCGGFHRAAAALHLSQSAVSQHLRKVESVVGEPGAQLDADVMQVGGCPVAGRRPDGSARHR